MPLVLCMETTKARSTAETGNNFGRIAAGAVLLAGLAAFAYYFPVQNYLQAFLGWIQNVGVWGMALLLVVYVGATLALVPGSLLTIGAGYAFGVLWGTILVSIGSTVAAALAFLIGRYLARDWVRERTSNWPRFRAIDNALGEESFKVVFLLRLVPLLPYTVLNYAFGASKVSFSRYFFASWAGMLPATVMYVYFGSLAEKATRLAAATPESQIPVWAVEETLRHIAAGDLGSGAFQNATYWIGFIAVVSVSWIITRRARAELERLTREAEAPDDPTLARAVSTAESDHTDPPDLSPDDAHNRQLRDYTHPPSWTNPTPDERYNFVSIGGGTAGLVGAAGAAGLGAHTALIEREMLGGDCLVTGCVPSKTLLQSAKAAAAIRNAREFGVEVDGDVRVDFEAVMERVRSVRAGIAEEDSAERFSELGVDVHLDHASFVDEQTLKVGDQHLEFNHAMIATGGRPRIPPIDGLEEVGYLTNETVFSLTERPERLAVVGGGPIGCELAQAFQRLGVDVSLFEMADQLLPNEDADAAEIIADALRDDGVDVHLGTAVQAARSVDGETRIRFESSGGDPGSVSTDEVLVAAGRSPNVEGLRLDRAGVEYDEEAGVLVDDRLRTSRSQIYAAGDVASTHQFTHVADAQARLILRNCLPFGRERVSDLVIPWATYTEPELAHVGLYPHQAREQGFEVETVDLDLEEVHRAVIEGAAEGFLKVHCRAGTDQILGATLVADRAGDLISELTLTMNEDLGLSSLADTIHPYPTTAAVLRRAGDTYNRSRLKPWVKSIFETWYRWMR